MTNRADLIGRATRDFPRLSPLLSFVFVATMFTLPSELIVGILARTTWKDIIRCKQVSPYRCHRTLEAPPTLPPLLCFGPGVQTIRGHCQRIRRVTI